jgi:hypothetical protein
MVDLMVQMKASSKWRATRMVDLMVQMKVSSTQSVEMKVNYWASKKGSCLAHLTAALKY